MVKHLVPKVLALSLIGSLFLACAPVRELAPYSNLVDQGLLPVSTTNPYLGANLFLAGEAQRSGYLMNFLKGRGGPAAIELESTNFSGTGLLMYYPKDREVYRADLQQVQRGNVAMSEWLVRGPYAIERRDYRELNRLDGSLVGEPVFMIRGQLTKFAQQPQMPAERAPELVASHEAPIIPVVPTPKPKVKKAPIITKHEQAPTSSSASSVSQPDRPLNSDQQALRLAQGLVERNSNGDGIHIVVSDKQTLAKLADWYTGSAKNAAAIAEASGIDAGKEPSLASRVIIPKALLNNEKRLTD